MKNSLPVLIIDDSYKIILFEGMILVDCQTAQAIWQIR